jgi:hypothetical protein
MDASGGDDHKSAAITSAARLGGCAVVNIVAAGAGSWLIVAFRD